MFNGLVVAVYLPVFVALFPGRREHVVGVQGRELDLVPHVVQLELDPEVRAPADLDRDAPRHREVPVPPRGMPQHANRRVAEVPDIAVRLGPTEGRRIEVRLVGERHVRVRREAAEDRLAGQLAARVRHGEASMCHR